jgi:hypothetical protein
LEFGKVEGHLARLVEVPEEEDVNEIATSSEREAMSEDEACEFMHVHNTVAIAVSVLEQGPVEVWRRDGGPRAARTLEAFAVARMLRDSNRRHALGLQLRTNDPAPADEAKRAGAPAHEAETTGKHCLD